MNMEERETLVKSYLGRTVKIKIDRPIGYVHKKGNYALTYPINYGYIPEVFGGDGEELDVYLLGVDKPITDYVAKIIGIVYRMNDVEDKLIAAAEDGIRGATRGRRLRGSDSLYLLQKRTHICLRQVWVLFN